MTVLHSPGSGLDDAEHTLALAAQRWERHRAEEDSALDTMLWLRAARGAWCLGRVEDAHRWYGRAADDLLEIALRAGGAAGSYAYYAELALGCAALSGRPSRSARVADAVRLHAASTPRRARRGRWANATECTAVAHEVLRAWAGRLAGDERHATDAVHAAVKLAGALQRPDEDRWSASHWPDVLAALSALVDANEEDAARALRSLDRKLAAGAERAPTAAAAVSETLVSLAIECTRAFPGGDAAQDTFTLVIEPGGRLGAAAPAA